MIFYCSCYITKKLSVNTKNTYDFSAISLIVTHLLLYILILMLGVAHIIRISSLLFSSFTLFLVTFFYKRTQSQTTLLMNGKKYFLRLSYFLVTLSVILIFIGFIFKIFLTAIHPPKNFDNNYFYLPMIVHWFQSGGISIFNDFKWSEVSCFPIGSYIYPYFLMIVFKNDLFIGFISPILICFSAFILYGIGRRLDNNHFMSLIFAVSIFMIPFFNILGAEVNNDVVPIFFTLSYIYMIISFHKTNNIYALVISGLSTGIVIGCKYPCLLWGFCMGFLSLLIILANSRDLKLFVKHMVAWFLSVLCTGGYWYVRNFILTGNFVFPQQIKILGIPLYRDNLLYRSFNSLFGNDLSWNFINHLYKINDVDCYLPVFGAVYILTGISCLLIAYSSIFYLCNIRQIVQEYKQLKFIFHIGAILSLFFILIMPATAYSAIAIRQVFPGILFLLVYLFFYINNKILRSAMKLILATHLIYFSFTLLKINYIIAVVIFCVIITAMQKNKSVCLFFNKLNFYLDEKKFKKPLFITVICLFIGSIFFVSKPLIIKHKYDGNYFSTKVNSKLTDFFLESYGHDLADAWKWLDANTDNNTIGYDHNLYIYHMVNSRLTNSLRKLSAKNEDAFLQEVYENKIDYIFLKENYEYNHTINNFCKLKTFPFLYEWMMNYPDKFNKVFENESVTIFRVI